MKKTLIDHKSLPLVWHSHLSVFPPHCLTAATSNFCLFLLVFFFFSFFLPNLWFPAFHDSPHSPARPAGVVFWSLVRRAWGPRASPPHVHHGWKVRTLRTERSGLLDGTCLLRSVCWSLGNGGDMRERWGENRWERERSGREGGREANRRRDRDLPPHPRSDYSF